MTDVTVIAKPDLTGKRLAFALAEDRIGHYAEFRAYFVRIFNLDRIGLAEPGFVQAPSGLAYALVFIGRSGEPFPSGVEVYAVVDALEPIDDSVLEADLWAILGWMIEGVAPRGQGMTWRRRGAYIGSRQLWQVPLHRSPTDMLIPDAGRERETDTTGPTDRMGRPQSRPDPHRDAA